VRSVLTQVHVFMGQLDANKAGIVRSIESLNRLAIQLKEQDGSIKSALDNLPAALKSIDSQRADLVKMLKALDRLSGVGVRVIKASKTSTINSLRSLAPVLDKLADAGSSLPNSLQVFLTYPFVDAAVGKDPQVARNLHMGDYTNLNARLDINVTSPPVLPSLPATLPTLPSTLPSLPTVPSPVVDACIAVKKQVSAAADRVTRGLPTPPFTKKQKAAIKKRIVKRVMANIDCKNPGNIRAKVAKALARILKDGIPGVPLPHITKLPSIPGVTLPSVPGGLPRLPRAGTAFDRAVDPSAVDVLNGPAGAAAEIGYNSTLAALLLQGVQDR
jgi:phospholipid/cholesterol/gamma-HCH transport system substrate-binding protein